MKQNRQLRFWNIQGIAYYYGKYKLSAHIDHDPIFFSRIGFLLPSCSENET